MREDKWYTIDKAQAQYGLMMRLLKEINLKNQYAPIPEEFLGTVKEYESLRSWSNSSAFSEVLDRAWSKFNISAEDKKKLEDIVRLSGSLDFDLYLVGDESKPKLKTALQIKYDL